MQVLFVSSSLSSGGAERFVSTALVHLDRSRLEPALCLFRSDRGYPLPDDVPVHVVEKRRPWQIPFAIKGLARLVDETAPDVVLSAFSHPSFVTGNALRLARRRTRWIARVSNNPDYEESGWLRPWMRALYRRADRILANSRGLRDAFVAAYPFARGRTHYLPNPVDFSRLDALAAAPLGAELEPRPTLVSVGRLAPQKRVDLLLEAVRRLRPRVDAQLVLCGDGPLRRRLERRAAELGVDDRVRFAGFCANPYPWMAHSDLFVLASDYEGLPHAMIEAQGLGLPVVSTDCRYGPSEIVEPEESGLLVPTGDVAALASAAERLLSDPERRRTMATAARERARRVYAAEPLVRALERHLLGEGEA